MDAAGRVLIHVNTLGGSGSRSTLRNCDGNGPGDQADGVAVVSNPRLLVGNSTGGALSNDEKETI